MLYQVKFNQIIEAESQDEAMQIAVDMFRDWRITEIQSNIEPDSSEHICGNECDD